MTQPHAESPNLRAMNGGRSTSHLIEKGWTVLDAIERPIGNVSDVDTAAGILQVDGRAQGFETYEVPLSFVERTGTNEVRLGKILDPESAGSMPRFLDRPASRPTTDTAATSERRASRATTGDRSRPHAEPSDVEVRRADRVRQTGATADPVGPASMSQFTPPYAVAGTPSQSPAPAPAQAELHEGGWSMSKMVTGALAVGGLAAAAYLMRRRMRRKTPFEQFMGSANQYAGVASDFTRNRHPAWWASLAAAALPLAYYAWPTAKPTYTQQAHRQADDLAGWLSSTVGGLTGRVPANGQLGLPSWRTATHPADWDWSPRPDVAGTAGALAVGALALYLLRRATTSSVKRTRIADVMTRSPRVIQPDATIADAALMMRRLDIGALPVCDGARLIGMLTDRDITLRSTADGRDPHLTPVRDVMSPGVAWATEDDPVEAAARIMREHRIRRLPIVDERHTLVGVVSLGDLAVDVADDDLKAETLERISEKTQKPRE